MSPPRAFPPGSRFNDWSLQYERRRGRPYPRIRRWVFLPDGSKEYDVLPTAAYADLRDNPTALKDFVIRLNNRLPKEQRTKKAVEIRHAFTRPELVDEFIAELKTNIEERDATTLGTYLKKYCLQFFTVKLSLPDPLQWAKHQALWGQALLNDFSREEIAARGADGVDELRLWPARVTPSDSTLKKIVQVTNEYLSWLHMRHPGEYPPLHLLPVKRSRFKKLRATRIARGLVRVKRYIPDADWQRIAAAMKETDIEPFVRLAYAAGLRQAETLAISPESVLKDNLLVKLQLIAIPEGKRVTGVVKGRSSRRVPFWMGKAKEFYEWAERAEAKGMHPDTLGRKWRKLMERMKLPYEFHDLRRTFITNSFRDDQPAGEIQLAAGHASISTTMRYKLDHRAFSDKHYNPKYDLVDDDNEG